MAKETIAQSKELIEKSKKILITTKRNFSGDGLAAALALFLTLKKMNKNPEIVIDGFSVSDKYSFLPELSQIKTETTKLKKFVIDLDISQTGIEELSYDAQGNNLKIYLSPKRGVWTESDLKFQTSEFAYDLIFAVDAPDLESIGQLYDNHRDLFYQIPVINIDNSSANEQYGHLNLVDVIAGSTCEILFELINGWDATFIDKPIATCLLSGIIEATQCFKAANVSPGALEIVGRLINLGANRQEIINSLYQTKTIGTLKLWGKILSHLQSDKQAKLIWSKITQADFQESGAAEDQIPGVIDELIANNPTVKIFLLFYQIKDSETKVIARSLSNYHITSLLQNFSAQGDNHRASLSLNKELSEVEKEIIESVAQKLQALNNN